MLPRWIVFCPEWLTGSPNLDSSNAVNFWVNLVVRVIPGQPPSFRLLKPPALVYEHDLGLGPALADVEFLPHNRRAITFNS